jgi:glycosyltransferase involved in cell wall biosynthesis
MKPSPFLQAQAKADAPIPPGLPKHTLSVVVPLYNEAENVAPLLERIHLALGPYPWPWEVVLVDDGSSDATPAELLRCLRLHGSHVRIVRLVRNYGQTAALQAGIDAARGNVIASMDGDQQNDPIDIPRMVARLLNEELDCVAGWRKDRQSNPLHKISSLISSHLIAHMTGVQLRDYACSLRVFRASAIKKVRLHGELHRCIPAWLATATPPRRVAQEAVSHHPRAFGKSKYSILHPCHVALDLIFVRFCMRSHARPGYSFGRAGVGLGILGTLILLYLAVGELFFGTHTGTRPLLFIGFFLIIVGLQLVTSGVQTELLTRAHYEADDVPTYQAKKTAPPANDEGWHTEPVVMQ